MGYWRDRADHGLVTYGLVERDLELTEIDAALARCASGIGETVLVEGPIGAGKTQVLEAGLGRAGAAGMAVFRIIGSPTESNTPLAAIWHLADSPHLDGAARQRLRTALYAANRPARGGAGPPSVGLGRVSSEVLDILRDLAVRRPVVVGIDDVQYLDAPSRCCIRHAARHLRLDAVIFLCAGTPDTGRGAISNVAAESLRDPGVRRLPIGRLSRDGVGALVAARLAGGTGGGSGSDPGADVVADHAFAQTGGNPLLVRAWIDECIGRSASSSVSASGAAWAEPAPAGAFSRMLGEFLRQLPRSSRDVLAALSILGDRGSVEAVAQLQGIVEPAAAAEIERLADVGLVTGCRFRSPVARDLAYQEMQAAARGRLHGRVARRLDPATAPPTVVADHLIAADGVVGEWGSRILQDAADAMLRDDRTDGALRYLEHALAAADGERRGEVLLQLATVAWRSDPAAAEDYLTQALAAKRGGALAAAGTETLASVIFAGGRIADALELVGGTADAGAGAGIKSHFDHLWAEATSRPTGGGAAQVDLRTADGLPPGRAGPAPSARAQPARRSRASGRAQPSGRPVPTGSRAPGGPVGGPAKGIALLSSSGVWTTSADESGGAAARRLLEVSPLTDRLLPAIVNAVKVLAFADRVHDAESWARRLIVEADRRGAPGWSAMLAALLAEILLLQGAFDEAINQADRALSLAPPRSASLFWMSPLTSHVLAHTRAGRFVEAATYLDRPPPAGAFASFHGLGYLRARGQYYLATGHHQAALDDFEAMGRVVEDWGIDHPGLVPWRLDAAEANVRLGRGDHAKELLSRQFAANVTTNARTRGLALRLRATAVPPRRRTGLLVQAVEELRRAGDRYELARTFADLGDVYYYAGDHRRAAGLRRKARQLAEQCGAGTLAAAVTPPVSERAVPGPQAAAGTTGAARVTTDTPVAGGGAESVAEARPAAESAHVSGGARAEVDRAGVVQAAAPADPPPESTGPEAGNDPLEDRPLTAAPGAKTLSESERRVATLAARGFSNRQIATRLLITVSTVEQHLTRAYRKLGITRRQQLPDLLLDLDLRDTA